MCCKGPQSPGSLQNHLVFVHEPVKGLICSYIIKIGERDKIFLLPGIRKVRFLLGFLIVLLRCSFDLVFDKIQKCHIRPSLNDLCNCRSS
jgi:hypothetical protein